MLFVSDIPEHLTPAKKSHLPFGTVHNKNPVLVLSFSLSLVANGHRHRVCGSAVGYEVDAQERRVALTPACQR